MNHTAAAIIAIPAIAAITPPTIPPTLLFPWRELELALVAVAVTEVDVDDTALDSLLTNVGGVLAMNALSAPRIT